MKWSVFNIFSVLCMACSPALAETTPHSPYPVNAGPFTVNNPPVQKEEARSTLHILSASYGLNCNPKLAADFADADALVKANNAYDTLGRRCDGATSCTQLVTEKAMGYIVYADQDANDERAPPAPGCAKELRIDYACSPENAPQTARMGDGGTLAIYCPPGDAPKP